MIHRIRSIAILAMLVVGLGAFGYATVIKPMGGDNSVGEGGASLQRFARGELEKLQITENLPEAVSLPNREIFDAAGQPIRLSELAGRVVLLNIWATNCTPCILEMPSLDRLQAELGSERFIVAPVSLEPSIDEPLVFYEDNELQTLPFYHDPTLNIGFDLAARGMPTTVVFGVDGREIARLEGAAEWDDDQAVAFLSAIIAREFS